MKLEHFGMAEPGDCRVVFSAAAEELEAAVQAEKAAPDAPQDEDDLLTAAVNRAILEGFSPLFAISPTTRQFAWMRDAKNEFTFRFSK